VPNAEKHLLLTVEETGMSRENEKMKMKEKLERAISKIKSYRRNRIIIQLNKYEIV